MLNAITARVLLALLGATTLAVVLVACGDGGQDSSTTAGRVLTGRILCCQNHQTLVEIFYYPIWTFNLLFITLKSDEGFLFSLNLNK